MEVKKKKGKIYITEGWLVKFSFRYQIESAQSDKTDMGGFYLSNWTHTGDFTVMWWTAFSVNIIKTKQ